MKNIVEVIKGHLTMLAIIGLWAIAGGAFVPSGLWLLILLAALAGYGWILYRTFRGGSKTRTAKIGTDYPEEQRKWLTSVRRHWSAQMEEVGLLIEVPNKNPELPARKYLPELVAHRSVPVGVILSVMPAAGKQSVDNILAAQGNLESIWGYPIRMAKTGPATVEITVEFSAPLNEFRASEDWMEARDAF